MPGEDGAWVEEKRRELADVRGRALSALADACLRSGDPQEAAKWAEQAIALEPFRETGYRRLMEAHAAAGNRAEALRVYERCRRLLAEELGAYPSPETESIYRGLLEAPLPTPERLLYPDAPRPGRGTPRKSQARRPPQRPALAPPPASETFAENGDLRRSRHRGRGEAHGAGDCGSVVGIAGVATIGAVAAGKAPRTAASVRGNAVAVVDAATARLVGSVPLGSPPGAIAYGAGSVGSRFPIRARSHGSRPDRGGSSPRFARRAAQSLAVADSALWAVGSRPTDPS